MKEGHQKSKILSYTAKFKCEVVWCVEEKETPKLPQCLELIKAMFDCG
jgi:hypothetical protein